MQFFVLGPLEVRAGDGPVAIPGRQPRALLALLLMEANRPVSADRIATALWGEEAPADSAGAVRVVVSRLRRSLGGDVLASSPAGYRLRVAPGELDSDRFADLVSKADSALEGGDPLAATSLLRDALSLWRGPALADVAFADFAQAQARHLEELRASAVEARIEADLRLGRHAALVPELEALTAAHPARERLAGQLMLALYRSGRQADALAVYQRTRARLSDELGLEPGPELRALQAAIFEHDPALGAERPAAPRRGRLPSRLPPRNPFFVGRDDAIAAVREALVRSSRIAVTGMPGVGKTQVAREYAERHRDQYGARLWLRADTRDGLFHDAAAIARALRLTDHAEQRQEHIVELLREWLSEHSGWLVILDNAEDLDLAAGLLAADDTGHVLITTREAGRGEIARHVALDPLDADRSAELLLLRAGAAERELPAEERAATTEVCARLGGLALAIDQAGAFIAQTRATVQEYRDVLRSEAAAALTDAVGATLPLAVRRLAEQDAVAADLLRLCAFFAPDAIPEEILSSGQCCAGEPLGTALARPLDRLRALRSALRFSLLQRDPETRTLSIHRLVQTVIETELTRAERDAWGRRAALALAAVFPTPGFSNWPLCERLMPHVLACADRLARDAIEFRELGFLLNLAAVYLRQRSRQAEAEPVYQRARAILERTASDQIELAWCLHNLGALKADVGHYDEAEELATRALELAEHRLAPDDPQLTWFLSTLARISKRLGRYDEAEAYIDRSIAIRRGDPSAREDLAWSLQGLGDLWIETGRHQQAERVLAEALELRRGALDDTHPHVGWTMASLGEALTGQGRYDAAEPLLRDALAIAEDALGSRHGIVAVILRRYATLLDATGRGEQARELTERAAAIMPQPFDALTPSTLRSSAAHRARE